MLERYDSDAAVGVASGDVAVVKDGDRADNLLEVNGRDTRPGDSVPDADSPTRAAGHKKAA